MATESPARSARPARQRLSEDERRQQILRATVEVVARRGYEAASASAIAEHAGVSKGLIWHYFVDKPDLMKRAVIAAVRDLTGLVAASADVAAPVPDRIRVYVRTVARLRMARQDEFRAMQRIGAKLENPDGSPVFTAQDYEELYQGQTALFRRGQEDGAFRDFDPRVMAVTYQGAIDAMFGYLDSHPEVDVDAYAESLADILLSAMMRPRAD